MSKLIALVAFAAAAFALAGCGDSVQSVAPTTTSVGTAAERAAVMEEAARHPEFMEDGVYDSTEPMSNALPGGTLSTLAAIDPITFWRRFRVADKHFEFVFSDTDTTGRPTMAL